MNKTTKILFIILVYILSVKLIAAQEKMLTLKKDKEFIAIAYFHVFNSSIPNNKLDNYLIFINGFGDKELLKNLLIKDWVFNNEDYANDSTKKSKFSSLSILSDSKNINETNKLINYFIFSEISKIKDFNFFKDGLDIKQKLHNICPNLCADDIETNDCIQQAAIMSRKARLYPEEMNLLRQYYEGNTNEPYSNLVNTDTYTILRDSAYAKQPMLKYYFYDHSVEDCLQENNKTSIISSHETIKHNLKKYINFTYQRLLSREPSLKELSIWESYFSDTKEPIPGMIFYAIMTSEEYRYF